MAASLSSPPCSTSLFTPNPCFRVDLGRGFLKSLDLGHQRPLKFKSLASKDLVVSASTNNAVSVTDPAPSLTRSKWVLFNSSFVLSVICFFFLSLMGFAVLVRVYSAF